MTTITPTMLAAMRHAAENERDADSAVRAILALVPGVTIADTKEQTMSTMTITPEELNAAIQEFDSSSHCRYDRFRTFAERVGVTIAPPEPPEAMVDLAEAYADGALQIDGAGEWVAAKYGYLAALQHVRHEAKRLTGPFKDNEPGVQYVRLSDVLAIVGAA